jgi:uncharacterized RDD family membrane protein YckC
VKVIKRGVGFILDILFLSLFFFPITRVYSGKWIMAYEDHYWGILDPICLVFLFIIFAYFIIMEAYLGWTIGKLAMRLRVVDQEGNKIGLTRSLVRNLLRVVDGVACNIVGAVLIARSRHGQRFGDRIAGTYVVRATRKDLYD